MRKGFLAFCLVLLLGSFCLTVSAWEAPDVNQAGSIHMPLPGGNILLYRVGAVGEAEGNFYFLPTGDFSNWDGSFANLQDPELAKELASFAQSNDCASTSGTIQTDGTVTFSPLMPGLYLLVQTEAAPGYELISPFLVSLPAYEEESCNYEIDATPKFQLTPTPTEPTVPQPNLPQTGQLNWPVPLLGISGLALFLLGLFLQRRRHG